MNFFIRRSTPYKLLFHIPFLMEALQKRIIMNVTEEVMKAADYGHILGATETICTEFSR